MKKIGIDFITGRISPSEYSHKAAWCYMYANQLKYKLGSGVCIEVLHGDTSWDDYDIIFIYNGMEFRGSLNIFGGATSEVSSRLRRLIEYNGDIISMDIPMPDYGELGKGRLKACDDHWKETDWDAITEKCKTIKHLRHPTLKTSKTLLVGDSHCFSMYEPGDVVIRRDAKTLYGALKQGLYNIIIENGVKDLSRFEKLTLCFGNIDVRHHLCRRADPYKSMDDMMEEYGKQISHLSKTYGIKTIELINLLPIENERRKLPKTGYYEGLPFCGEWRQRNEIQKLFNLKLKNLAYSKNWDYYEHPRWFQNGVSELDFEFMERSRSVHLARKYYRWDLVNDRSNYENIDISKIEYKNVHLRPLSEAEEKVKQELLVPKKKSIKSKSIKKNRDCGVKLVRTGKKENSKDMQFTDLF